MAIDISRLTSAEKKKEERNVGGLLGGFGYLGEKAAVGFVQSVEGIADYTSAGLAKLFGADDFAEKQMREDWFGEWYAHPDEWYKPGKGWQFAGDVASGIGSSVPSLAVGIGATVLTAASGGTAAPATVPMLAGAFGGGITAGLSAAGGATKEAYSETGELGGKEFGYGLLSGVVEGGTEALTNALSLGTGAIIKNVGKSIAKEAVETVSRQTVVKGLIGSFAGEAFEEGFATWISPTLKHATYDKNAKSASFGEITYSAITGGIARMVMDGGNIAINAAVNIKNGASAVNRGFAPEILGLSQRIANFENANKTGNEAYEAVAQTYKKLSDSIAKTGGEVRTTEQMRLLGELQRGNTAAVFTPMVTRSAAEIYANAEAIAQRLTEYGYTDKPVTAEDIRKGVNPEDAKSFSAALKENTLLRELAVADVTGHLIMNTRKFKDATLAGKNYASQADLNRFAETATPEEIRAVSEALGIESWETLTPETFEQKVVDYMTRGGENVNRVDAAVSGDAGILPNNAGTVSGTRVITDNVRVITDNVGKSNNDIGTVTRRNAQTAEEFARANVRGYNELSATNQGMIRKVIRAANASGMSQNDARTYAEVSAHSGIDIVFDKEACRVGDTYADGYYDADRNRIVVNPEGTRSAEKLLLHELDHAIRLAYGKDGRAALVKEAYLGISPEEAQKITAKYRKIGADTATILDEANAYFAETALADAGVLERLWQKEKTLGEKIVEFFTGAKEAYKGEKKLEGAAKRYEKMYREMFRGFAEKNRGRNATETRGKRKRYALPEEVEKTLFDDEFYEQFAGESKEKIIQTAEELENIINSEAFKDMDYDTQFDIRAKLKAVNAGYTSLYDYYVGRRKASLAEDYERYIKTGRDNAVSRKLKEKQAAKAKQEKLSAEKSEATPHKNAQFEIIQKTNPMYDEFHTGIRSPADIKTFAEVVDDADSFTWGDFTREDAKAALEAGKIRIYSSYAIKNGVFVSTSYKQALDYAGDNAKSVHSRTVALDSVAWINGDEGQYAKVTQKKSGGKRYALPEEDNRFTIKDADELIREVNGTPELETPYTAQRRDRATHTRASAFRVFEGVKDSDLLSAASRDEIVSRIYEAMNSTESMNERKYVSRQIAEIYVRRLLSETPADTGAYRDAKNTLAWAGQGIRKIRFTKSDAAKIKKIVGEDEYKRLRRRWGSKTRIGLDEIRKIVGKDESERIRKAGKGRREFTPGQLISLVGKDKYRTIQNALDRKYGRYTVASYAKMIANTVPQAQKLRGVSPYAALVDIDKTYSAALSATREAVPAAYETDAAYAEALMRNAEDAILQGFADQDKAVMQRKLDETAELAERSKAELTEINKTLRYRGYIASSVQTLRDMKKGTFDSASEHKGDTFDKIVSTLAGIEWRKNLSVDKARKAFVKLEQWYTKDNPIFAELAEDDPSSWNKDIADMVHSLVVGKGAFTVEQFANIDNVLRYFVNYIKNYNKVFYQGKLVEAVPLAEEFVELATEAKKYAGGAFFKSIGRSYLETFADPATVVRRMDGYRNGFYTQMLEQLRQGAIKADVNYYNLTKRYEEFMDKNKNYLREAEKATVEFADHEIPKMQAIGLYMTMKREHAHLGLLFNGFAYLNGDGEKVRVNGFAEAELSPEEAMGVIAAKRRKLEESFTPEDIEYISILEKVYNEDARALKASRDMQRYGFTNAMDDYYYPIRRANTRQKVDTGDSGELDRVSSASFNKDIVTGAAGELLIENADTLFRRHARAVSQYEALSPAIEAYNKIFNLDVSGNKNKPVSVRTETEGVWANEAKYMRNLVEDVQGIKRDRGEGMEFLGKIRSGYAKFQLGANPKTLASQISSIFASSSVLDYDAILGSTNISGKEVDSYCTLAMLRNADNTAAMAQGNLTPAQRASRKIDTVSDALMKPIGMVDRFVVTRLFAACQKQIELRGGEKVGTVQNKVEAGKLLERVIIETQQNSFATERSAAMRSGNEFYRTVTMFTSDAMKTVGRAIDAFGEVAVLRKRAKAGENVADALSAARKQMMKSTLAMAAVAAYSAAIAQFFRWVYNKDKDEDETVVDMMITDFGAAMLGGLPIIKEVYAQFTDGYGLEDYTLASFNDLLAAVESVTTFVPDIITGKAGADDIPGKVRSLAYAVGQFTGLPVRNVYNMLYGITKRVAPNAAYRVDDFFMDKNYTSDLRRAVESGDEKRAYMLMGIITGQRIGDISEEAAAELHRLAMAGYSVIPREVNETFTADGEEYTMTADELSAVSEIYGASATEGIAKLTSSRGFASLSDTAKADAVRYVYQVSYDMAIANTYGIDRGNAALIADAIGADAVALAYAATKGITSDTDRKGKTVDGSKRKKVIAAIQSLPISTEAKLLLICAKGYTIKDGDVRGLTAQAAKARLKRYVSRLPNREKLLKIIK